MRVVDAPLPPGIPVRTFYGDEFSRGLEYRNWRPRGSGDWLFLYTLEGAGELGNGEASTRTLRGELVLFEKDAPQFYVTAPHPGQWRFLWIHCGILPLRGFLDHWPSPFPGLRRVVLGEGDIAARVEESLRELVRLARGEVGFQVELMLNAMERVVLLAAQSLARLAITPQLDPRIERAVAWYSNHLDRTASLREVATEVGLSPSRFSRLFHAQTGETPQAYHEERRLRHAAHLLHMTSLRIYEVAEACGFSCPYYFCNRFRRRYGLPPRDFRRV